MKPLLKIADNNFGHGTSLGSGDLKIYPTYFQWYRGQDKYGDVVVLTDNYLQMVERYDEQIKVAWLLEPPAYSRSTYDWVAKNYNKFDYVLTYDAELLKAIPNGHVYFYGGCWIEYGDRRVYKKTKNISIIVSDKKITEGHRLRHEIVEKFGSYVDVFGKQYKPIHNKITALRDYKYSIVIENEKKENWFTEKLIDTIKTGTIPIYWGSPTIESQFDTKGMYEFSDMEALAGIVGSIANGENRRVTEESINNNFVTASQYCITEDWLYRNFFKPKGILP